MKNISEYIESGIIESYVLGITTDEEARELEKLAVYHAGIRAAIETFSDAVENAAQENTIAPDPIIKPMIFATIDFIDRMQKGEPPSFPPALHNNSDITEYAFWLDRPDMVLPPYFEGIFAKLIGHTSEITTAIVWIKDMAPQEVHNDEYEKFLIVEGTCNITIGEEIHRLVPGDFLSIPLHFTHSVKVTSDNPCKVILQRVAA